MSVTTAKTLTAATVLPHLDGVRQTKPNEWMARCPCHDDKNASLHVTQTPERVLLHCFAGCSYERILEALGINGSPQPIRKSPQRKRRAPVVTRYDYHDENGALLFQVERTAGKEFPARRPNGNGGWLYNLEGVRRVPYNLPEVLACEGKPVWIVEGEKDCDRLASLGLVATTSPGGAGKWRSEFASYFEGKEAVLLPDNDDQGRKHMRQVAESLRPVAVKVTTLCLPGLSHKGDVSDWLDQGHTLQELVELLVQAGDSRPSIARVVETFQRCFYMPDPSAVLVALATYAGNRLPGDPVWVLLVAPPATGKTETLGAMQSLPFVHTTATLTEAGLLSGSPAREKAKDAKGGLLRQVGSYGFILAKDFGSVLSQHRETRAATLAALREIFDGAWVRHVGTDGGRELRWKGKVGLLAAVTPAIDLAHSVMSCLGERFLLFRLPSADRKELGRRALALSGQEKRIRAELAATVREFFEEIRFDEAPEALAGSDVETVVNLADLVSRARSGVARDPRTREIEEMPATEAPPRLVKNLAQMLRGFDAIGLPRANTWPILFQVALDCIPALRRAVIQTLQARGEPMSTADVAEVVECPTVTTRRALEDLTAHHVTERAGKTGNAHLWCLSEEIASLYPQLWKVFPETSQAIPSKYTTHTTDIPGTDTQRPHLQGLKCPENESSHD